MNEKKGEYKIRSKEMQTYISTKVKKSPQGAIPFRPPVQPAPKKNDRPNLDEVGNIKKKSKLAPLAPKEPEENTHIVTHSLMLDENAKNSNLDIAFEEAKK